jgi:MOSC domain-containing protein YiiM
MPFPGTSTPISRESVGDPACHLTIDDLVLGLRAIDEEPPTARLSLIVRRAGDDNLREVLETARLTVDRGLAGDAWERRLPLNPDAQLAVMSTPIAALVANGQPVTLFGDNLFVDLDLSTEKLPVGTRVRIGSALLQVTPKPHNGCEKFVGRFGADALAFVARKDLRPRNLRGIYLRVVEDGDVAMGDSIEILGTTAVAG